MTTDIIDPQTLTLNQQGWWREYETLKQIRDANRQVATEYTDRLRENPALTLNDAEQRLFDDAKFNWLESERRIGDFRSDRYTAMGNDRAKLQWELDHTTADQLFKRDQLQTWIGNYDQAALELSQMPVPWETREFRQLTIGDKIYNNLGIMRWDPSTITGKLANAGDQITETFQWIGDKLSGVSSLDSLLSDSEKYSLCKVLSGLIGGYVGGKMLASGMGLPSSKGLLDILAGKPGPSTFEEMARQTMSDTFGKGTNLAFKLDASDGACKVFLPKADLLWLGVLEDDPSLTADYYTFTFTSEIVSQVVAEEAASDAATRLLIGQSDASASLLLAAATQSYNNTLTDFTSDPAATWNGWLLKRAETQTNINSDLASLGQWTDNVLTINKAAFDSVWQSDAATPSGDAGPVTNTLSVTVNPNLATSQSGSSNPLDVAPVEHGTALGDPNGPYQVSIDPDVLNSNQDIASSVMGDTATGGIRPGNFNYSDVGPHLQLISVWINGAYAFSDYAYVQPWESSSRSISIWTPADPLILDLNGDGVRLTSFQEHPVLFDADHDGGSKEKTGWVAANTITTGTPLAINTDGIVVYDLNNNGIIDDISETLSEYFNGTAGTNGNQGTKPFTNGFTALKSLDSNNDNVFSSADAAWNNVRVWVDDNADGVSFKDVNGDGVYEAGIDTSELKTLAELGIGSINLVTTTQSGLVNGGNEILATGSFVIGGQTREAQAANFLVNPDGSTFIDQQNGANTGTKIVAEGGTSSYASLSTTGEAMDAAALGVQNLYGGTGNDTLIGDADANWLTGSLGSDVFNAGAGDDVLLIDASDLQANIHAGSGTDLAIVVDDGGVTLNLAQAELEIVQGGRGDDILIGGGRSTVFIRGGDGDDVIIGGAANDALSGENGNDLIDGGAGNDLIRGQRGEDVLRGGAGDDILDGGTEDDSIFGGAGNDVLIGSQGDDTLDGGDGTDIAQFTGNLADYRITKIDATTYRVVDTRSGRDGADVVKNIEKLAFTGTGGVDITLDSPFPVKDVIAVSDRNGAKLISVAQLLANDIDWQGDALHITTISEVKGGTIAGTMGANGEITPALTANGELTFTPDPAFTGVMSFKYKIADADNTPGATAIQDDSNTAAEMRGQVFIKTPDMPTDPVFTDQWYLADTNVIEVWKDYTGKGVRVGQFEPSGPFAVSKEIFDYRQPDLAPNIDPWFLSNKDMVPGEAFSQHATLVAGVIAAARNGEGAVGVAYDATIAGYQIGDTVAGPTPTTLTTNFSKLDFLPAFDVSNHSWGFAGDAEYFAIVTPSMADQYFRPAVQSGRGGLGSNIVMAGGNSRQSGGNTNYSEATNNRFVVVTGAINAQADISTLSLSSAPFSNPGASILISAPGSNISSTSRILQSDQGTVFGNDTQNVQGTSFATPIISGIVALMLQANPNLGYRDVQKILALSARRVNDSHTDLTYNTATNWNGGGMHVSHDYGFGDVDALAAVRLAETWYGRHAANNERHLSQAEGSLASGGSGLGVAIADGSVVTRTLSLGSGIRAEHVEVTVDWNHSNWGDLTIELIAPSGIISKLAANPGTTAATPGGIDYTGQRKFTFDTTHDFGESSQGDWQLRITDRSGRGAGTLNGWKVDVYGSDFNETANGRNDVQGETPVVSVTGDDIYFYTNEFATSPGAARNTLNDANGGLDIINAAGVSSDSTIDLNNGSTSTIAGRSLTISGDVESVFGGDGNDTLIGNALANRLDGGRGNDILNGGDSVDFLDGGKGNDTLTGGAMSDFFVIRKDPGSADIIADFSPTTGAEKILFVGFDGITDFTQIVITQEGVNTRLNLGDGQSVLLQNVAPTQISEQNFGFFSDSAMLEAFSNYMFTVKVFAGTSGAETGLLPNDLGDLGYFALGGDDVIASQTTNDFVDGGDGNDTLWGDYPGSSPAPGADWLEGGAGNDSLLGGPGDDRLLGGSGDDILDGGAGNDILRGATGTDQLYGGDGNDLLAGGAGNDYLGGGIGDDVLYLDGDLGAVDGTNFTFYGTRVGGAGADIFRVTANGGGDAGIFTSSTQIVAYNLIADFDPNQAGEVIDLRAMPWIRGFGDLTVQYLSIFGTPLSHVSAANGLQSLTINMRGVTGGSLNADDFVFAVTPGLFFGGADDDTLIGDAAGNTLDGGAGADNMTGRTGDDTYVVDNEGDMVNELPGGGFDTVKSSVFFALPAEVENLVLTGTTAIGGHGNAKANRITGNSAANVLDGEGGADVMLGGSGNDTYIVDVQADVIIENENEGFDTAYSSVSFALGGNVENLILTGSSPINATGNALDNILAGNVADNVLDGTAGADTMVGGDGNDTYFVDNAGDRVTENADQGIDTVYAGANFTLDANVENLMLYGNAITGTGNALDNVLTGNTLNNTLSGGAGNDFLDGGAGADILIGGAGDDLYLVDNLGDSLVENTSEGTDTVQSSVSFSLASLPNIENVVLTGTANINATGNAAANRLIGNDGANALDAGGGNDLLDGGAGADTMIGGAGDDIYVVDNVGDAINESAGGGVDTVIASVSFDISGQANLENIALSGIANLNATGNGSDNVLTGNGGANILTGGAGNDTLDGSYGADTLIGGSGNDAYFVDNAGDTVVENAAEGSDSVQASVSYTLAANVENLTLSGAASINGTGNSLDNAITGNAGNNVLVAGAGADTLIGGAGSDTLIGGTGDDLYVFNPGFGMDTISESDATVGNTDTIRFGAGIAPAAVVASRSGLDLVLSAAANAVTVQNWFGSDASKIERVEFADSTVWNVATLRALTNLAPTVVNPIADRLATEDQPFSFTIPVSALTDADAVIGDMLSYSANIANGNALPAWLSFDAATGTFSGTPANGDVGTVSVRVTATDTVGASVSDVFDLGVINTNDAPTLANAIADQTTTQDAAFSFTLPANTFADVDAGDTLTYGVQLANGGALPSWLNFDALTHVFSGTPANADVGTISVRVTATDSAGVPVSDVFDLSVANVNDAPIVANAIADQAVTEQTPFSFTLPTNTFADVDAGDTLVYSAQLANGAALPAWLSFDAATGSFSGTPAPSDVGTVSVRMTATDAAGASGSDIFDIDVRSLAITGTLGDDHLLGTAIADTIYGLAGNDTLDGGAGADSLIGGPGDDTYVVDDAGDAVVENAAEGTDTVQSSVSYALGGNVENLTLTGSAAINGTGNALDNVLTGNSAGGVLTGGLGNDTYAVVSGNTVVVENSGEGTDTVQSSVSYTLSADVENLTLTGTVAINGTGNALNNVLDGSQNSAANVLTGGLGNDTYVIGAGDSVVENVGEGTDMVRSSVTHALSANVENLTLTGSAAINGTGNALLNVLVGNSAANVLDGGMGADTLVGGLGDDTYVVDSTGDVIVENPGEGTDTVRSSVTLTLNGNVENLILMGTAAIAGTGNALNNVLDGSLNSAVNTLTGGLGDDTYVVGTGDTVVESFGGGTDTVISSLFTYALTANVENLTLTGTASSGQGNALNNVLIGNSAANTLLGDAGADTMIGGLGNDTYVVETAGDVVVENPGEGTDTIQSTITYALSPNVENLTLTGIAAINGTGNELNNVLRGNTAANVLTGGLGDDTYTVDVAGDVVVENAGEGIDTVQSSMTYVLGANVENLTLISSLVINGTGNALNNVLTGNGGANALDGGGGTDTLIGGAGNDTYVVDDASDTVVESAGLGTDMVLASISYALSANVENLTLTGSSAITGTGNTLANVLDGTQNSAANALAGGLGDDTYVVGAGDIVVENANEGTDTVQSSASYTLGANVENLTLTGSATIDGTGNALNNVLDGSQNSAANVLTGGLGNDTYVLGAGDSIVENAGEGVDTVQVNFSYKLGANLENLTLTGFLGTPINATGNELNNVLRGNNAANVLDGGAGADDLGGGIGDDTYIVDNVGDLVTENFGQGTDTVQSSVTHTLRTNVENLVLTGTSSINGTGNALNNVLTGNSAGNVLDGNIGPDTMIGGAGDDTYVVDDAGDAIVENAGEGTDTVQSQVSYALSANVENLTLTGTGPINGTGNALDNVLTGNSAANVLTGGLGNDTYVATLADTVVENAGEGIDTVTAGTSYTLTANVENLILVSSLDFTGTGNTEANLIRGNLGNNVLSGAGGIDVLEGGVGNDTLSDSAGLDNGYFNGGAGVDSLTGGAGAEFYLGGTGNDTINTGTGFDILAFNKGDGSDIVNASASQDNVLSLGSTIAYSDLFFRVSGTDLILDTGVGEGLTFKDWYTGTGNKSVLTLQVIAEAMAQFDPSSVDPLLNRKVQTFDFAQLANAFDAARAADPSLPSWALLNGLTQFHLSGSDTDALGGDLAYQYGENGTLAGVGFNKAQDVLTGAGFGTQAQTLRPLATLQDGFVPLS